MWRTLTQHLCRQGIYVENADTALSVPFIVPRLWDTLVNFHGMRPSISQAAAAGAFTTSLRIGHRVQLDGLIIRRFIVGIRQANGKALSHRAGPSGGFNLALKRVLWHLKAQS